MAAMRGYAVAALALMGLLFSWTPVAERIDLVLLDVEFDLLRKFDPKAAPDDIIIVGIDDRTFQEIPEPLGLWHEPLGRVLAKLASAKPRRSASTSRCRTAPTTRCAPGSTAP